MRRFRLFPDWPQRRPVEQWDIACGMEAGKAEGELPVGQQFEPAAAGDGGEGNAAGGDPLIELDPPAAGDGEGVEMGEENVSGGDPAVQFTHQQ